MSTVRTARPGFAAGVALVFIVSLTLLSCGGGGEDGGTNSTGATLVSIAVTPANSNIAKGMTQQFIAAGTYSDGTSLDITALATWASDTTAVATINTGGLATGIAGGVSTITAGLETISGSTALTVTVTEQPDTTPPVVSSSTPDNMATGVTTTSAKITVLFNEAMNAGLFPTVTTEAYNGTAWVAIPNTGTTLAWASSTTLDITMNWLQFPERTSIRWTLSAVGLEDAAGNQAASDVQRSFTTSARNTYFPIADTGQSMCSFFTGAMWNGDSNCLDSSPAYAVGSANNPYGQDGHYVNKPRAWTFSGPTAYVLYPGDRTTTDSVTGLVWKTCIEGQLGTDCAGGEPVSRNWYDAVNACTALNGANGGAGYGGRTHWRLPTKAEVESFPSYGIAGFSINDLYFPHSFQSDKYWTASTAAFDPALAWTASALYGDILSRSKTENRMVRCVAAPDSTTIQVLSDNGNGTVLDNVNDLTWQKCSMGQNVDSTCSGAAVAVVWAAAVNYCENLNFASRTDWRLPNVHELQTLTAASPSGPAIDATMFPHTASAGYWTGSTHGDFPVFSWYVSFGGGETSAGDKSSLLAVRCVAGP